jgi:hypothetical protein
MIDEAVSADPYVLEILRRHPKVGQVREGAHAGIDFRMGSWRRSVLIGDEAVEVAGLVELIDNNPMVCADVVSVPPPAATLALIGLGPLAWAGLLVERPVLIGTSPVSEAPDRWLKTAGWDGGATVELVPLDPETPNQVALVGIGVIATPEDWDEIDTLYDERFARSFYVRRVEDWTPATSVAQPYASYHLQYTPGDEQSLLRVSVSADLHGKCGAAQVVHAMNVMAGLEESLGLADSA